MTWSYSHISSWIRLNLVKIMEEEEERKRRRRVRSMEMMLSCIFVNDWFVVKNVCSLQLSVEGSWNLESFGEEELDERISWVQFL